MRCPRQSETGSDHEMEWRSDGTCSYCGSISAAAFMDAIREGREVGPTDKNYKAYITVRNPRVGQESVFGSANFNAGPKFEVVTQEMLDSGRGGIDARVHEVGSFVLFGIEPPTHTAKFYFQHLNEPEQREFVALHNSKKIRVGFPGYFYVMPFFMVVAHG